MTSEAARIIVEEGIEAKIAAIAEPVIEDLGYRLVRVRLSSMNGQTLQIMAERPDGTMAIEDCEAVSRALSPVLEVEDPLDRAYHLEVSSPGIDRPLVRRGDFETWAGFVVKIETNRLVVARKRFRGRIIGVEGAVLRFERDQVGYGEEKLVEIPVDAVHEARLVLTDELIAAALKADKAARRARGLPETDEPETEAGEEGAAADVAPAAKPGRRPLRH